MTERILYIDDDPINIDLVRMALRPTTYRLVVALDGDEGLAMIAERPPDLVICDLMLPDINGVEIIRRLRQDTATHNLPIIVLTADYTQSKYRDCLEAGANDYLTKPINRHRLIQTIQQNLPGTV